MIFNLSLSVSNIRIVLHHAHPLIFTQLVRATGFASGWFCEAWLGFVSLRSKQEKKYGSQTPLGNTPVRVKRR